MKGLKLSNKQVEVLANEIYSELEKEANKYKESEEYKNFEQTLKNDTKLKPYIKLEKAIKEVEEAGLYIDKYYAKQVLQGKDNYIKKQRDEKFPKQVHPSHSDITNKIILNTIDVDNLEDLISKVKESLTAKK